MRNGEGLVVPTSAFRIRTSVTVAQPPRRFLFDCSSFVLGGKQVSRPCMNETDTCTVRGTRDDDVLRGTPGNDVLCGLGGDDRLMGFDGNDHLIGDAGKDSLRAAGGDGQKTQWCVARDLRYNVST